MNNSLGIPKLWNNGYQTAAMKNISYLWRFNIIYWLSGLVAYEANEITSEVHSFFNN